MQSLFLPQREPLLPETTFQSFDELTKAIPKELGCMAGVLDGGKSSVRMSRAVIKHGIGVAAGRSAFLLVRGEMSK
jgi:hypothetical protein